MMQGPMGGGMRDGPALQDGERQTGSSRVKTFESLKVPAYRLYFIVVLGQMGALNMQMVARSWFVFELTGKIWLLGALALANAIPMLALSLFGGVLADRIPKKNVLIIGQAASALVTLAIGVSISLGSVTWVHLLIASFLQGVIMALMMPARQAIIPELVGPRMITNAVALNGAAMNLLRLVGPAIAGFLIALWNIEGVYYIMAILYGYGAFVFMRLPVTGTVSIRGNGVLSQVGEGISYIRNNANILALLFFTLLSFVFSMPYMFLLPAFTDELLTVDVASLSMLTSLPVIGPLFESLSNSAARQGLLISVSAIGALGGSFFIASMQDKKRGFYLLLSVLVMAVSLVAFSMTDSYLLALLICIPLGLGQSGRMALSNTLAQAYTEDEYRGRVMSIYMLNWGMTSVGVFFVAILADFIGVQWAVGSTAAILVVMTLYYLFVSRRIREMD